MHQLWMPDVKPSKNMVAMDEWCRRELMDILMLFTHQNAPFPFSDLTFQWAERSQKALCEGSKKLAQVNTDIL